jgi:hypothetical protein
MTQLATFENKVTSQFGEDGVIDAIFKIIPPRSRYFVEFGIGPNWLDPTYSRGLEGNCVELRRQGWRGLMMDAGEHPPEYDVRVEFIEPASINDILEKHGVPKDVDVISIDVDGQDWWIWKELRLQPVLVVIEYNGHKPADISVTVPLDPKFRWDGTDYYGASLLAMDKLAQQKGYTLVFANGVNAFFVLTELLINPEDFRFYELYRPAANHTPDPLKRPFGWI